MSFDLDWQPQKTLYAKPAPTVYTPWIGDEIASVEAVVDPSVSQYLFSPSSGEEFIVYLQAGASPVSTDFPIATITLFSESVRKELAVELARIDVLTSSRSAPGDAMAMTLSERSSVAGAIEVALVNDGDATAFLRSVADKIAGDLTVGDITTQAIASATRDAILDRVLTGNHDVAGTVGLAVQNLDASVASRLAAIAISVDGSGRVALAPAGLDAISNTKPGSGDPSAWTFRERLVMLTQRFFGRVVHARGAPGSIHVYDDDGVTPLATQSVTDDGTTQDVGGSA